MQINPICKYGEDISSAISSNTGVAITSARKYENVIIISFRTQAVATPNANISVFSITDPKYYPHALTAGSLFPATDTDFGYGEVSLSTGGACVFLYSKVTTYGVYGTIVYGI